MELDVSGNWLTWLHYGQCVVGYVACYVWKVAHLVTLYAKWSGLWSLICLESGSLGYTICKVKWVMKLVMSGKLLTWLHFMQSEVGYEAC